MPTTWEVRVYPGATLHDATNILYPVTKDDRSEAEYSIIYMGVNNREDNVPTVEQQVREVVRQSVRMGVKTISSLILVPIAMEPGLHFKIYAVNQIPYCLTIATEHSPKQLHAHWSTLLQAKPATSIMTPTRSSGAMALHMEQQEDMISGGAAARLEVHFQEEICGGR